MTSFFNDMKSELVSAGLSQDVSNELINKFIDKIVTVGLSTVVSRPNRKVKDKSKIIQDEYMNYMAQVIAGKNPPKPKSRRLGILRTFEQELIDKVGGRKELAHLLRTNSFATHDGSTVNAPDNTDASILLAKQPKVNVSIPVPETVSSDSITTSAPPNPTPNPTPTIPNIQNVNTSNKTVDVNAIKTMSANVKSGEFDLTDVCQFICDQMETFDYIMDVESMMGILSFDEENLNDNLIIILKELQTEKTSYIEDLDVERFDAEMD